MATKNYKEIAKSLYASLQAQIRDSADEYEIVADKSGIEIFSDNSAIYCVENLVHFADAFNLNLYCCVRRRESSGENEACIAIF